MAHGKVDYDKTETNSKAMIIFLVSLVLFLILTGAVVLYMTKIVQDNFFKNTVSELDRPYEVVQLRSYENNILTNYGVVDETKGIYQIPIEKAIDKVVRQYQ